MSLLYKRFNFHYIYSNFPEIPPLRFQTIVSLWQKWIEKLQKAHIYPEPTLELQTHFFYLQTTNWDKYLPYGFHVCKIVLKAIIWLINASIFLFFHAKDNGQKQIQFHQSLVGEKLI